MADMPQLETSARRPWLRLRRLRRMPRLACAAVMAVLALCLAWTRPAAALDIEFSGRAVKRDILALYDGRRERLPHDTRIHKFAEVALNYLGFRVTYQDVNQPMPQPAALGSYRGVLTWFVEPLRAPDKVVEWLEGATAAGLKLVVMGEMAPPDPAAQLTAINRILARLGLEQTGEYIDLTWRATVVDQNPDMVGFERPLDKVLPGFPVIVTKGSDVEPHLVIEAAARGGRTASTVIATSAGGGFASGNYTIYYEPNTDKVRWTLNPFAFFKKALGAERFPVPDTTTLSGRRIYFSHIDGDGWNNITEIEEHRAAQRLSAEVIAREAIIPYPDLPVTVGLIAGDVDSELGGNPAAGVVARMLYALPQVEVGSHTYSHPYNWQFFETYERSAELAKIDEFQPPDESTRDRLTRRVAKLAGKQLPSDKYDRYVAGTDDLPRTYLRQPFDLDKEVAGALRVSESFAPKGKPAKAYLWSGDTTPFPDAIRAVRNSGSHNLNGGDSRFDAEYPSVTYVPPISRPAGAERQIYSGNSNENTYTNDWTGPYYGYFMLEHTLDNTEKPRRLKPFNLYYHMYSGEKTPALAAVKHFLALARAAPVAPIPASVYSQIADDFFATEIEQVDLFSWAVTGRGRLQTVRFDAADQLVVDTARSAGVIGFNRHQGAMYVTLDPAVERAVVTLRSRAEEEKEHGPDAEHPATLVEARWLVSKYTREGCGLSVEAEGFGPGEMTWRTAPGRAFEVSATRGGDTLYSAPAKADADGRLTLRIEATALEPVTVRLACHE